MNRLTEWDKNQGYFARCLRKCNDKLDCNDCLNHTELIEQLGKYEDIGLSPEELKSTLKSLKAGQGMLTAGDVGKILIDNIREGDFYGDEECAGTSVNYICGMADLAYDVIKKMEEEKNG